MSYYDIKPEKKFFEKTLEDYRDSIWGCARCNWCQNHWGWNVKSAEYSEVCPAFHEYRIFPYSGMGKMHIARALLEGDFDYEDAPELAAFVYTCTTCGACEMNCQRMQDKEPLQVNETLRAQLVRDGIGPMPEHRNLIKSVKNYDNPWMQPRSQRDRWARRLQLKDANKEKVETLFFVGCTSAFDNTQWRVAQHTAQLLLKGGVDLGILGKEELCCGSPVARIGDRDTFMALAARTIEKLNSTGAREIVTFCPGCYRALTHDYPEIPGVPALTARVYHSSQMFARLIGEGKLNLCARSKCASPGTTPVIWDATAAFMMSPALFCGLFRASSFTRWSGSRISRGAAGAAAACARPSGILRAQQRSSASARRRRPAPRQSLPPARSAHRT